MFYSNLFTKHFLYLAPAGRGHFELLRSPRETEMALAHFGRDISHPPRVPLEAVFNSLKAGIGGI